jgi:hypothetical protein
MLHSLSRLLIQTSPLLRSKSIGKSDSFNNWIHENDS